jgi:hypothetical protein
MIHQLVVNIARASGLFCVFSPKSREFESPHSCVVQHSEEARRNLDKQGFAQEFSLCLCRDFGVRACPRTRCALRAPVLFEPASSRFEAARS